VTRRLLVVAGMLAVLGAVGAIGYALLGPDPQTQARADGCGRSRDAEFARLSPGWVYVNDRDFPTTGQAPPVRSLEGLVQANGSQALASHPSGGDDPTTHDSFDLNFNVLPDPQYTDLLGGNPAEKTGNFEGEGEEEGRVHVERETTGLPFFAWPEAGDRVKVTGSWVWDCGHWDPGGERTEIHPYRALWDERNPGGSSQRSPSGESEADLFVSTDATPAGEIAECSHRTRGNQQAYKACTFEIANWLDVSGDYDFTLPAPRRPRGAQTLVVRVVDEGSTVAIPKPQIVGRTARLQFHLDAVPGRRLVVAQEIFLGWKPVRAASTLTHLRVTFTKLLVRRAMDPGCPAATPQCGTRESTLPGQNTAPPGEWLVYSDAAGLWRLLPRIFRAADAQSFTLHVTQDLYVGRGKPWRLLIWTHECDFGVATWSNPSLPMAPCPKTAEFGNFVGDDVPGLIVATFASPAAAIGMHVQNGSTAPPSTCPASNARGCYALTYRISRVVPRRAAGP
jgi:hypothetical protein